MIEKGIYFVNRPLTDVEFRVILEYNQPTIDVLESNGDFVRDINEQQFASPVSAVLVDVCTFKWQQKIHFRREMIDTAQQLRIQSSSKEKRINQDKGTLEVEKDASRVFTLIDGEEPIGIRKVTTKFNTNKRENKLAERIAMSRNRRVEPTMMSCREPVINLPSREHQMKTRRVQHIKQVMYIMAYLGPVQDNMEIYDGSNQYVLCKITVINETNVIVEPDLFSASNTIESRYGNYKARLFIINNEKLDHIDNVKFDQRSFKEEEEEMKIVNDFPSEKLTKLVYLINIERAINFPQDGLYIEYKVDLPLQCALIDFSPMYRWTIISDSNPQGEDDVAVISQPVCVTLIIKEWQASENFYWPKMVFRLCGEDYWGRSFVNGFGQLTLPSQPGSHEFDVKCWRHQRKQDRKSMMFEHYISKMAQFERTELTLPSESKSSKVGPIASSIGLGIRSSGTLKINVHCIMQKPAFTPHKFYHKMKYDDTLVRHTGMRSRIHWNILKVLSEFEEAKRNFLKIWTQPTSTFPKRIP
uniref:Uncharacterized protein n=1 Tax=Setaria digitata TaxID=48799 RepID=A0A915PYG1_9BILA